MGDTDYKNPVHTAAPTVDSVSSRLSELKELMQTKFEAVKNIADERDRRYEDRFTANDEKTSLALTSAKEAVGKAEIATEKRFDAVNEFRKTLSDQTATFIPRAEADAIFSSMNEKISGLREYKSSGEGKEKAGQHNISTIISVLAVLIALAAVLMRGFGK